jgi:hypothetical protein
MISDLGLDHSNPAHLLKRILIELENRLVVFTILWSKRSAEFFHQLWLALKVGFPKIV